MKTRGKINTQKIIKMYLKRGYEVVIAHNEKDIYFMSIKIDGRAHQLTAPMGMESEIIYLLDSRIKEMDGMLAL